MMADYKIIKSPDGVPVLQFALGENLSWFRGYRMQVSGSVDGIMDFGSSSSTMEDELGCCEILVNKTPLQKLVLWGHVVEACAEYPVLEQVPEETINAFMTATMQYDHHCTKTTFSLEDDVKKQIKGLPDDKRGLAYFKGFVLVKEKAHLKKPAKFIELLIGENYIALNGRYLELPKPVEGDIDTLNAAEKVLLLSRYLYVLMWEQGLVSDNFMSSERIKLTEDTSEGESSVNPQKLRSIKDVIMEHYFSGKPVRLSAFE